MKRLFVLTIKYIPIIQLIGMLINNSLYTYDINIEFDYIGDFLLGNSIVNISMLYVCSFTFGFCNWHRHIITANLINIIINFWFEDEDAGSGKVWNYFKDI